MAEDAFHASHERRGRAHVEHREGPDPAFDDPRRRDLRPAARLDAPARAHRTRDARDPAAAPARAVAAVPHRTAALGGRVHVRPRLPPAAHCGCPRRATRPRCSTRCNRSRRARFDRARPLWEFTLFEGLEGGRAALAMKVHHSITDGVGGMALLTELVDLEREPEPDREDDLPAVPGAGVVRLRGPRARLARPTPAAACSASRAGSPAASRPRRSRRCAIPSGAAGNVGADRAFGRPAARAGDDADVAGHARPRSRSLPRDVRTSARRPEADCEVDRGQPQRRVPRRGHRWAAALPRAPRRRSSSRCA